MGADLDLLRGAAHEAGRLALDLQQAGLDIQHKEGGSPVTNADLALDALIKDRLRSARPDYAWLSEETVDDPARLAAKRVFIVDPIDGTRAFLSGRAWWSVSLAVVEDGRALCGVVYAAALDETYEAELGGGARLNGAPIRANAADTLEACSILATRSGFMSWEWPEPWPQMQFETRNSVALRIALVAAGSFDATVSLNPKNDWDIAAGMVIAEEAGALVTDHKGAPLTLNSPSVRHPTLVVAGPCLHPLILARTAPIDAPADPAARKAH